MPSSQFKPIENHDDLVGDIGYLWIVRYKVMCVAISTPPTFFRY